MRPTFMNHTQSSKMECAICYKEMHDRNAVELDCDHALHVRCLEIWTEMCRRRHQRPACPTCRSTTMRHVIHIDTLPRLPVVVSAATSDEES